MMINKTVSYYNNADDSKSRIRYNLDYVLGMIRGNQELFQQTARIRSMPTEEEYKQAKKLLPMIAPSGIFDYRNDNPENLREYSNVLVLDFDHFQSHLDAGEFKRNLIANADRLYIYALWFSPSGLGVKVAMIHDNTTPMYHNELFRCIREQLYPGIPEFDDKCGNLSRTFFLSSDPEIYINPQRDSLTPYHFEHSPSVRATPMKGYNQGYVSNSFTHTSAEIIQNNCFQIQWKDKTLINYIDKKWRLEYPESYEDGHRHQAILSRAKWLCRYGVLYENALAYLTGTFGLHEIDKADIEAMVINNYNANRGDFGKDRMRLYLKKEEGRNYRNQKLKGE